MGKGAPARTNQHCFPRSMNQRGERFCKIWSVVFSLHYLFPPGDIYSSSGTVRFYEKLDGEGSQGGRSYWRTNWFSLGFIWQPLSIWTIRNHPFGAVSHRSFTNLVEPAVEQRLSVYILCTFPCNMWLLLRSKILPSYLKMDAKAHGDHKEMTLNWSCPSTLNRCRSVLRWRTKRIGIGNMLKMFPIRPCETWTGEELRDT